MRFQAGTCPALQPLWSVLYINADSSIESEDFSTESEDFSVEQWNFHE